MCLGGNLEVRKPVLVSITSAVFLQIVSYYNYTRLNNVVVSNVMTNNSKPTEKTHTPVKATAPLAICIKPVAEMASELRKIASSISEPTFADITSIQEAILPIVQSFKASLGSEDSPLNTLIDIQRSLSLSSTQDLKALNKEIQEIFQAPLIAEAMFADNTITVKPIVRDLQIDVGSFNSSIELSDTQKIKTSVVDISNTSNGLTATLLASRTDTVSGVALTENADIQLILNELDANKREIAELKKHIVKQNNQQLISSSSVGFKLSTSSILIGTLDITIEVSSNQARLARTVILSSEGLEKKWDIEDLVLVAFGERVDNDEKSWIKKIDNYIYQFNLKVTSSNNKMSGFLKREGVEVFVNPEYLSKE